MSDTLDQLCVNTLRFLSVDMVQKANSGHPGLPLDAAPMAYVLWTKYLKHNPANPQWFDRDRFVLSAGHGSALLYSLLHVTGYDVSLDDIKQFRQWGSKTPGHPERLHTPGVEITTGPLGQGFANAVGFAIAEAHLAARYNRDGHTIIDHYTYSICSDGDLMEGVASEAASLAGPSQTRQAHLFLRQQRSHARRRRGHRLHRRSRETFRSVRLADASRSTTATISRPSTMRSRKRARKLESRRMILVRTHLGYGSPEQDSFKAHGSPLGEDNVEKTKQKLGWPTDKTFYIPDEAIDAFPPGCRQRQESRSRLACAT